MIRLQSLDPKSYKWLEAGDECWHYGEYTADGGYQASETNRWIGNLKKKPTSPSNQLYWKNQAILYWGNVLRQLMPPEKTQDVVTFVPMPGSKPFGHADYDDRMLQVLRQMAIGYPNIDIRPVLIQTAERQPQHHGSRYTPDELLETLAVDPAQLAKPLRSIVFVVDDVITMGASFAAAKSLLVGKPNASKVRGVFLAKTVWPTPDFSAFFPSLP
jgi:hypothetical protein